MVHLKRIELTNFKSFGGTTGIPLLPGFTVVSGPNGSGKSNILDAMLFALGLSSSKGMRAERLPDLVNNSQSRKSTVETRVTVTFDLTDFEGTLPDFDPGNKNQTNGHQDDSELQPSEPEHSENGSLENKSLENNPSASNASDIDPKKAATNGGVTHEITTNGEVNGTEAEAATQPTEWSVTRKLRVTTQNTYTSTYYINGQPCTQSEVHEQLANLRIYPEGYNVVLQGDVTGIITMKPRERREIIDELAGVAQFDRKINLAKEKLDTVKEREERCHIVQQELVMQRDRLDKDRLKAQKYQRLRDELHQKSQWESVLSYRKLQKQTSRLQQQIETGELSLTELNTQLQHRNEQIQQTTAALEELNAQVKAMGEEELIALQSTLATQEAESRQLQQRQQENRTAIQSNVTQTQQTQTALEQHQKNLENLATERLTVTQNLETYQYTRNQTQEQLNQLRESANAIAEQAEAWVQQQTELHRRIETLQTALDPKRAEQAKLRERVNQLQQQVQERQLSLKGVQVNLHHQQQQLTQLTPQQDQSHQQIQALATIVKTAEEELHLQQETQTRLLREQQDTQRQIDKLEAQQQAQQEAAGTYASKVILQTGLPGVCGLVCQLGRVDPEYQLALEIAAGGRLGNIVVEDDGVAAAGIELLKRERAGRATFLPLNKIRPNRSNQGNLAMMRSVEGLIDYAVNLVECDPRYQDIFAYVFGQTMVFRTLAEARRQLGKHRIVTLEGELLEASGAMTGGSQKTRSALHFGTADTSSSEVPQVTRLKQRLSEIERILERCLMAMEAASRIVKQRSQELIDLRQTQRDAEQQVTQLESQIRQLTEQQTQLQSQLEKNAQELSTSTARLELLEQEIPTQEAALTQDRATLAQLEETHRHTEWQQLQATLRTQETELQRQESRVRETQQRLTNLDNQQRSLEEKIATAQTQITNYQQQAGTLSQQDSELQRHYTEIQAQIAATQTNLAQVAARMGEEKQRRDQTEANLREQHLAKQQAEWEIEKLQQTQAERREQIVGLQEQLQTAAAELPDPLPEVPETTDLGELQKELRSIQKRMESLEPVNMLALEEFERTQARLDQLSQKLSTLESERTEILLRIENFTTLRRRAFQETFDAVNQNFQVIFAELSDGDGYLQVDDLDDPFNSGLNLVAHPKGKPVQRLASMSGGEKSLTALSFIFALQRHRPSTFYAFDEVDMFLDGANVERLAKMIRRQAEQAQFIVGSLRRPMMEASERTIGVTQARGAYTQVLGIRL
ncbi:MAG: chromosome segregation protein SMC [Microcoleaceae cyanobacterium]